MRNSLALMFFLSSCICVAKEGDWITRIEMEAKGTTDIVWLNSQGDIFWSTDLYLNSMPCKSTLEGFQLSEFNNLVHNIPRIKYEYQRDSNNKCKDGLNHSIFVSFEKANGSFESLGNKFASSQQCQVRSVDLTWEQLTKKLYSYTATKFKECRAKAWR
jgi:hypothetical protein